MYYTDDGAIHGHLSTLGRAEADFERGKALLYRSDGPGHPPGRRSHHDE
jgi:hypothetical protein